ncbi:MAG TPA: hypothetical protein PLL78_05915 [Fimbriimonadaceae bacterium]|nr:hypothetical protein [Fimbriimonadaceae bacterium]HRJ96203.1 hypothetical protein [Fimbriimonadaceae bacterium]
MKSLVLTLTAAILVLTILATRSPVSARQSTLEERVRSLELQVASLNQRVGVLEGRIGSGGVRDNIPRTYTGIGETWILKDKPNRGYVITLGNNTRWQVAPKDGTIMTGWKTGEVILIGTNDDPQFPYSLTNQTRKQRIVAQYAGQG